MARPEKPRFSRKRRTVIAGVAAISSQVIMPIATYATTKRPTSVGREKMDVDRFVEDCLIANQESDAQAAVREVLAKAVSTPNAVISALGEPENAGLNVLLSSSTLTIFAATWTPQMNLMPHDHLMWANIGIYTGREDNIFWERSADGIKASGAEARR
jgi:predicted metal-dependent enzyme (double-stranded beta helix superfamily)